MTTNAELFVDDPTNKNIPNLGVAKVGEPTDDTGWAVLRYELSSFVCDGQYAAGLDRILSSYLGHVGSEQPAAWVSGFYGSGKSHLVRVLEYLWRDIQLPDGATARGLVNVTQTIEDALRELSTLGRRHGGLWSAAGTLGSGSGSVRLAFLSIVLGAAALPEQLAQAQCVMWLRDEGLLETVRSDIESRGLDWQLELDNMYVSQLAEAILAAKPGWAPSGDVARTQIHAQFPEKDDLSLADTMKVVDKVLRGVSTEPGRFPCALVVLDEMQQFINEDPDRAQQVQLLIERCSRSFGGQLLIVATGQSALQATAILQKLIDRFDVQVQLSDADVEGVIRQVVLAKRQDHVGELVHVLDAASGEIDRHLAGARIAPSPADSPFLVPDYPLLPSRRRFWEEVLRAVDTGGKAGQLRTQLKVVHEAARRVAGQPVGTVVPADFIYDEQASGMLQTGVLLREIEQRIAEERAGGADGELRARIIALVFLISQLSREGFADTGVRPTATHIADLLVDDLNGSGGPLRQSVPRLLKELHAESKLQRVDDEYQLQTKVGQEWTQDYRNRLAAFLSDASRVQAARDGQLREAVTRLVPASVLQGVSKTTRKVALHFGDIQPNLEETVPVWVRNGWDLTEKQVNDLAAGVGTDSPLVFVYLPKVESDGLRQALAEHAAAQETLDTRANPTTDEGRGAQRAMQTNVELSRDRIAGLVKGVLAAALVIQAGGNRVDASDLSRSVDSAIRRSLDRLYPSFADGDHVGWAAVFSRAQQGNGDCLEALGYTGPVAQQQVCKAVLGAVTGVGRSGNEIRKVFESAPYGWPRDAVHGALAALLVASEIGAEDNGMPVQASGLTANRIGKVTFRPETEAVPLPVRLAVRALLTEAKVDSSPNEEAAGCAALLLRLADLASSAGGAAPLPAAPSSPLLGELKGLKGNQLILTVHGHAADLRALITTWARFAARKTPRTEAFSKSQRLAVQLRDVEEAVSHLQQLVAIGDERRLLDEPDPLAPLVTGLTDVLRAALVAQADRFDDALSQAQDELDGDETWGKLSTEQRRELMAKHGLAAVLRPDLGTTDTVLAAAEARPLRSWDDRIAAVAVHLVDARTDAAKLLEPSAFRVTVPPSGAMRSDADLDSYVQSLRGQLAEALAEHGSIFI